MKPPRAEQPSLPGGEVRQAHDEPTPGAHGGVRSPQVCHWVWQVLKRVAKDDQVIGLGGELGRGQGLTLDHHAAAQGDLGRLAGDLHAGDPPGAADQARREVAPPTTDVERCARAASGRLGPRTPAATISGSHGHGHASPAPRALTGGPGRRARATRSLARSRTRARKRWPADRCGRPCSWHTETPRSAQARPAIDPPRQEGGLGGHATEPASLRLSCCHPEPCSENHRPRSSIAHQGQRPLGHQFPAEALALADGGGPSLPVEIVIG